MDSEELKELFGTRSQEEARKRALLEEIQDLKAEQEDIFNDFNMFFEFLLPEEEISKRYSYKHGISEPSDKPTQIAEHKIVLSTDYKDEELGPGIVIVRLAAVDNAREGTGRVDDYSKARAYRVTAGFYTEKEEYAKPLHEFDIKSELYPNGQIKERGEILSWRVYGTDSDEESIEKGAEAMRASIKETDLQSRANKTLSLLLKAAENLDLNPEFAEIIKQKREKPEELSEES